MDHAHPTETTPGATMNVLVLIGAIVVIFVALRFLGLV